MLGKDNILSPSRWDIYMGFLYKSNKSSDIPGRETPAMPFHYQ